MSLDLGLNLMLGSRAASGGAAPAVQGDIIAARVNSDGWTLELDIQGFKVGGNKTRGKDDHGNYVGGANDTVQYSLDPLGTPKVTLSVTGRSGFDPTTGAATSALTGASYGTISKRKAYSAGGAEQTNDETDNGTYVTIRLALSSRVAPGEILTLDAASDIYLDNGTGGSGLSNNACSGLAVTNNSSSALNKPIVAYLTVPRQFLRTDQVFEASCAHERGKLGRMAAAMRFTWTGATSGVTISRLVLSMSLSSFLRTDMPRVCVYKDTLTTAEIATFTQGEEIRWSVDALPFEGPAWTAATDGYDFPNNNPCKYLPFICNKSNTLLAYATVDASGTLTKSDTSGCNTTGVENTTAGTTYSCLDKALSALYTFMGRSECSGAVIYYRAGTYAQWGSGSGGSNSTQGLAQGTGWVLVTRAPSTSSRADVVITTGTTQSISSTSPVRPGGRLHLYDLTLTNVTSSTANDAVLINRDDSDTSVTTNRSLWVDNCAVTNNNTAGTPSSMFNQIGQRYFTNNDFAGPYTTLLVAGGRNNYLVAGNNITNCNVPASCPVVGNRFNNCRGINQPANATVTMTRQVFYCFNWSTVHGNVVDVGYDDGGLEYIGGVAIVQNLIENYDSVSTGAANQSGDGSVLPSQNGVKVYNTTVGERSNEWYNSYGTAAVAKRAVIKFNIYGRNADLSTNSGGRYIKRDTFSEPTYGKQAGRTGNWSVSHMVDGGWCVNIAASQFGYNKACSNSDIGDHWHGGVVAGADVPFVDDQAGTGLPGFGDYHLDVSGDNDAVGVIPDPDMEMLPFDLDGNARDGSAGCYAAGV